MKSIQVMRGILNPDGSLHLQEKPLLPPGDVEVTLARPTAGIRPTRGSDDAYTVLLRFHEERARHGQTPRSREQIDADIRALRRELDEHLLAVMTSPDEASSDRQE